MTDFITAVDHADAWDELPPLTDEAALRIGYHSDEEMRDAVVKELRDRVSTQRVRFLDTTRMLTENPPPVPWVVNPMLARGNVTLLAGREGQGKSMVAMAAAAAVLNGSRVGGMQASAGGVVYLDAENGENEIARRMHLLGIGNGLHVAEVEGFDISRHYNELDEIIQGAPEKPSLVVIDSLRSMWGGDENNPKECEDGPGRLRALARKNDCAILVLHHVARATGDYRGSTALGGAVQVVVVMKRENAQDPTERTLYWRKCRPAKEPNPKSVVFHTNYDRLTIMARDHDA